MINKKEWKKLYFNANNIEKRYGDSVLIKMPASSNYKGYKFWYPLKLIREANKGKGYYLSLSYTNDFTFTLLKTRKKYITSKIEIDAEDIEEAFTNSHEDIKQILNYGKASGNYTIEIKPQYIDPKLATIDEDLML